MTTPPALLVASKVQRRGSAEYRAWQALIQRCTNPNNHAYANYGGRGIKVCPRWRESFDAFLIDMGHRPSELHSIDRVDVNGNYEPGNCRWATRREQAFNKRNSVVVPVEGGVSTAAVSDASGIKLDTLRARIRRGWEGQRAAKRPVAARRPATPIRIGERFGRLLVVENVGRQPRSGGHVCFRCLCDCGGTVVARDSELSGGVRRYCRQWCPSYRADRASAAVQQ